jgi:hypothetical protein
MATQKQIEANRRNSRKSTGPRSAEGRAASSQNALKSGIYANSHIIRGENAEDLDALKAEYYGCYHPTTPAERMLVDTLIDSEWLLRRHRALEANLWEESASRRHYPKEGFDLAEAYRLCITQLDSLQRRINAAQRNYRNALKDLERLQAASPSPEPLPPEQSEPQPDQPFTTPIGFVPSTPVETPLQASQSRSVPKSTPLSRL